MTTTEIQGGPQFAYGPRIALDGIRDLYDGDHEVVPYTPPESGIDNLGIRSVDEFRVPALGDQPIVVEFRGWVRVVRAQPTTDDWKTTEVYTNLIDMHMTGACDELGEITVRLQREVLSTGCINTPFDGDDLDSDTPDKACRMAVACEFDVPRLGKTLFNKEPVELTIDEVRSIPPAGNPGRGQIYRRLPLYDRDDPAGRPVAYLTSLNFSMGTYLPQSTVAEIASG
jgi:Family of unknown function (DUF6073)